MLCRSLPLLFAVSACAAPFGHEESPVEEAQTEQALHDATTIVTLTFDDTFADNFQVGEIAARRGMRATFYVNSSRINGLAGYMTKEQLLTLQSQGHEIGGHTITHARLTAITEAEARREVCNDRAALLDAGFAVTSFAYPFAANSAAVEQIVEDCGYNSARDVGGLACSGCPLANPVPPTNIYAVRTHDSVNTGTTLAQLQQRVIQAEQSGGGYVPFVFHHVCDGCNAEAISPALLGQFLDWLAARGPATQVGTEHEVIGGTVKPGVRVDPPTSSTVLQNPSLEIDANANQVPDCWQRGSYGTNSATYTLVNDAFHGSVAQRISITSFSSGGRRLVTAQDTGACAPAVTPGRTYTMTAYYKATTQPRFSVYYRTTAGAWVWFAQSPLQPTSSTYRQVSYTTPPMPSDATAISFGLTIFNVGTLTVDQHTLVDNSAPADTTAPTLATTCNGTTCSTATYTSPVTVALTASDSGSGVREIRYTTNGSDPTNGTLYTAPFTVSSTSNVRATAVDNAGNRTLSSTTITIGTAPDQTPPALSITCNGAACATTSYPGPVTVALAATDAGSGVREIRYTTDGSNPTNGTLYTGPFVVSATATVRSTAVDNANNRTNLTTTITVAPAPDQTPPALSITCNGAACSSAPYSGPVTVTLAATDTGSGVREIRYTTDGSDPSIGTTYTGPFTVSATTTVRAYAADNANNTATSSTTITIGVDQTPPSIAFTCNAATCSTAAYSGPVTVALSALDDNTGVREIRYTLDGSDPTTGTLYTGPFTVSTTTTVRAYAVDNANNAATSSLTITVGPAPDQTPPSLSIACNGGACAATYSAPVQVTLAATDSGSGVREIRYTLDGSDPTNGTVYTAPFTVASSATVRAIAFDNAGNQATQTASITIQSAPPPPVNLLQNASLEADADNNQIPDCWKRDGYGTNTVTWALTSDAVDGARAQRLDITSWSSGGRRLASAQDAGTCAPAATPGRRYTVTAYYKASVAPKFSVYVRSTSGAWRWFAESPSLPTSTTFRQATWTTPALPSDVTHISVGVSIFNVGSLTTDLYTLVEAP